MDKILGTYSNIVIMLLNVYCSEINAGFETLQFWSPNPLGFRRTQQILNNTIKLSQTVRPFKFEKPILRTKDQILYDQILEADTPRRAPKHFLRHGHPHYDSVLKNDEENHDFDGTLILTNKHTHKKHELETSTFNFRNEGRKNKLGKKRNSNLKHRIGRGRKTHNRERHSNHSHNVNKNEHLTDFPDNINNQNSVQNKNNNENHNMDVNQNDNQQNDQNGHNQQIEANNEDIQQKDENQYNAENQNQDGTLNENNDNADTKQHLRIPKLQPEPIVGKVLYNKNNLRHHHHDDHHSKHHRTTRIGSSDEKEPNILRSTKMTPLAEPDAGKKDARHNETLKFLNPHGLKGQLEGIMAGFKTANVTIESLGHTAEYKDILLMKITERQKDDKYFRAAEAKFMDEAPEKKIIFIVHGLSVIGLNFLECLHAVDEFKILLGYYLKHLHQFDIFLMPIANPDGYFAVLSSFNFKYPYWNKNMSPQEACYGVTLDRNFGVAWNVSKKVSSCSPLYPGKTPFSEVETRLIRDIFHFFGHKILAYIHVHGGTFDPSIFKGDAILYPRGYSDTAADDDKYIDLKGEIDEALKNASFEVMSVTVDNLYNWYGRVAGSSVDFASTVYGIPYALEFVMQTYNDALDAPDVPATSFLALTEIWGRLIKTTFNYLYKTESSRTNEVDTDDQHGAKL